MAERELSPTSYIVLGLLELGPATPYELKSRVAVSLGNFWTVQHAQLYSETARLAEEGLLSERREEGGRRRKTYSITAAGKRTLKEWLRVPAQEMSELRHPGLLKLFFGADPAMIAPPQLEALEAKLDELETIKNALQGAGIPRGMLLTLEAGIGHVRESLRFWSALV
jgi:PadR family transcriptional regulator, regulatory protein AphA